MAAGQSAGAGSRKHVHEGFTARYPVPVTKVVTAPVNRFSRMSCFRTPAVVTTTRVPYARSVPMGLMVTHSSRGCTPNKLTRVEKGVARTWLACTAYTVEPPKGAPSRVGEVPVTECEWGRGGGTGEHTRTSDKFGVCHARFHNPPTSRAILEGANAQPKQEQHT